MLKEPTKLFLFEAALIFSVVFSVNAYAGETYYECVSQADGNWNESSTWTDCNGGFPDETTSKVTILHNVTLTEPVNTGAPLSIYINSGALYADFDLRAHEIILDGGNLICNTSFLFLGTMGAGGLFIQNADSHFVASAEVNIEDGEGYKRTAGSADWITNNSILWLNSPGSLEIPDDTYYGLSLRTGDSGSYKLKGDTTVQSFAQVEAPLQIGNKTFNVNDLSIDDPEKSSISLTTGKLRTNHGISGPGTILPGQGTVELFGTGNAQFIGNYTFYNLKVDTSSEEGGKALSIIDILNGIGITVTGSLTLNGAPGKELTLASADPYQPFFITVTGNITAGDYLNVSNSQVIGGTITTGSNSVDGGGNSGWIFGYPTPTPTATPTLTPTPTATPDITPLPDTLGPKGGVKINKDKRITTSRFVILTLSATDPSLPLTMRLSNNGKKWTAWKPYRRLRSWDLTNKENGGNRRKGYKWVYVQYRDNLKNRSKTYIDRVKYIKK